MRIPVEPEIEDDYVVSWIRHTVLGLIEDCSEETQK